MIATMYRNGKALALMIAALGLFATGCPSKTAKVVEPTVSLTLDKSRYAVGDPALLTVVVNNPNAEPLQASLPTPDTMRLYLSMQTPESAMPKMMGGLTISDAPTGGEPPVVKIDGNGSSDPVTFTVNAMPSAPGEYIVTGVYNYMVGTSNRALPTNQAKFAIE